MILAVQRYAPNADMDLIERAYRYADGKHKDQLRKSGEPYIIHPLAVAEIVAEIGLDSDAIAAALLHDCLEDTDASFEEISRLFGETIAELVEGVTKLTRVNYSNHEDEQMENLRKMFMAMSRDIRVILIKIADRLHNMRTMQFQSPDKQRTKSLETMENYAPLATGWACSASSGSWRTPPCAISTPWAIRRLPTRSGPSRPPARASWPASSSSWRSAWPRRASAT